MPEIYRIHGIKIYINFNDHAPPHIHAQYEGSWALFEISDGSLLAGRLDRLAMSVVKKWVRENHDEVLAAWNRAAAGEDPGKVGHVKRSKLRRQPR